MKRFAVAYLSVDDLKLSVIQADSAVDAARACVLTHNRECLDAFEGFAELDDLFEMKDFLRNCDETVEVVEVV